MLWDLIRYVVCGGGGGGGRILRSHVPLRSFAYVYSIIPLPASPVLSMKAPCFGWHRSRGGPGADNWGEQFAHSAFHNRDKAAGTGTSRIDQLPNLVALFLSKFCVISREASA